MTGTPPRSLFWAKLQQDPGDRTVRAWHPLPDHCADVAACCEALLMQPVIRRRLAKLGGVADLTEVQVARLSVLAALHDAGKFNIGFQNKALPGVAFTSGHVTPILGLFDSTLDAEAGRLAEALSYDELIRWSVDEASFAHLLFASLAHHGRPVRPGQYVDQRCWRPGGGLDPFSGIADLIRRTRQWFPEAYSATAEPLPGVPAFQHAFSGLVTLADWLGSDTDFFPYSTDLSTDRMPFARDAARRALARVGLDPTEARLVLMGRAPGFEEVFGFTPHVMQEQVMRMPLVDGPSLTILESETGSGKTEAALARYLELFRAGRVDGLYFALPTRTAAKQMQRRVVNAVERAFPPDRRPPVVLAVPGYLVVDRLEGTRLPDFDVLWPDNDRERVRYRGWAAENPKRYLAGAVVVGTVDQALLSALTVSHAHLRASALLRHLLVVDEVHASDAYMTRLLEEVVRRHLQAGGHVLLMSATLGATARARLLSPGGPLAVPPLEDACAEPYPVITFRAGDDLHIAAVKRTGEPRTIRADLIPLADDAEGIASRALAGAHAGARVLVVRNTVRDCVATQEALEHLASNAVQGLLFACRSVPAPHHARFASPDRVVLDRDIESQFGKDRPAGGCVAVATQTVQQSLDLDADLLITDLCPMDVLLQRLGRLHRHAGRRRPAGFASPRAEVLVPADRDLGKLLRRQGEAYGPHGFGTVYRDLLVLEATWRLLERYAELVVPAMNRQLVEMTTHPEALERIAADLGELWREHWMRVGGASFAQRGVASANLVRWSEPFGESVFPDGELDRTVRTRLGAGDRIARFPQGFESPFGQWVTAINVPAHLAGGVPDDAQVVPETTEPHRVVFRFGPRCFVYDRLGLRPLALPPSPEEDLADA